MTDVFFIVWPSTVCSVISKEVQCTGRRNIESNLSCPACQQQFSVSEHKEIAQYMHYMYLPINFVHENINFHYFSSVLTFCHFQVEGSATANCFIFKASLILRGYILETHLPIEDELNFRKFPLKNRFCISAYVKPFGVEVIVEIYIRVLFFMKRRKRFFRFIVRFIARILRKVFKWWVLKYPFIYVSNKCFIFENFN